MEYFVYKDGETYGPFEESSISELLATGQVSSTDLVAQAGTEDWKQLNQVFTISEDDAQPDHIKEAPVGFALSGSAQARASQEAYQLTAAEQKYTGAYTAVFVIGAFNMVFGLLSSVTQFETARFLGQGPLTLWAGILMAVLGVFVYRKSILALGLALLVYLGDCTLWLVGALSEEGFPPLISSGVRIAFVVWIASGFSALRRLKTRSPLVP